MICPSCGYENLPGQDRCADCLSSLTQDDVPQPSDSVRWRVMVDPISSLEPSTIPPQVIPAGTSLADAVRRMQEQNVGYVMVTGPDGRLAGLLTEQDLVRRAPEWLEDLGARPVETLINPDPTTLEPSEPIAHALHFMAVDGIRYLPLTDEAGRPQDLLSFRRVARLIEQME